MTNYFKWSDDHYQFIKNNIKGTSYKELHKMFIDEFDVNVTFNKFKGYVSRKKLTNDIDATFDKGATPWNKGKKGLWFKGAENTWFKKGHEPTTKKPIGSIYEPPKEDRQILIKVNDTGVRKNDWIPLSHAVYTKHYGEVPKGHAVIHKNKNNRDFTPENLQAISRGDLAKVNKRGMYDNEPEYNTALIKYMELDTVIKELKV